MTMPDQPNGSEVAIIGMAGRFPGANNLEEFWRNLCEGVESITYFADDDVAAQGAPPATRADGEIVRAAALLDNVEWFDAEFFGMPPREAELTDPQHRILLECAWEALESAGYNPDAFPGAIGVYAGATINTYLLLHLAADSARLSALDPLQLNIANGGDFLTTRISYKLNLKGPSHTVQSACSTSLVALHLACQSILNEECEMALAGGVSVNLSHRDGYRYRAGGVVSPDGHCRTFDADAQGTMFGNGVGLVVLKRLSRARADGDNILAVIKGSAVNNDGAIKVGYTAPSVEGQTRVIAEALRNAGVAAGTIGYVEAHGTATTLGDPIEVQALTRAFRMDTQQTGGCAIGSVKTNVGHLDAAAGVTSLIKTVLALQHGLLPPSLHFRTPNPAIDFANSPFFVNTALGPWPARHTLRRAGVSAFGAGGTNAHMIVEEAPPTPDSPAARPWQLLVLSAQNGAALEAATTNLAEYIRRHPQANLADIAYTLQVGRRTFNHRRVLVCRDHADALVGLADGAQRARTATQPGQNRPVVLMFPGLDGQLAQSSSHLYETEAVFREQIDRCAALLKPYLGRDIREVLYPDRDKETRRQGDKEAPGLLVSLSPGLKSGDPALASPDKSVSGDALDQTMLAEPALFSVEYALGRLWMAWGVRPLAMIGHGIGELVAACLAGVFSLEDAVALVGARAQIVRAMPATAMLVVPLAEDELQPLLGPGLGLVAINSMTQCVVGGPADAIDELAGQLEAEGIVGRRLPGRPAVQAALAGVSLEPYRASCAAVALHPPSVPIVSGVTGTWIAPAAVQDPSYWVEQFGSPVRFADGLATMLEDPQRVLLEVGLGQQLSRLALRHPRGAQVRAIAMEGEDRAALLAAAGEVWLAGGAIDWDGMHAPERRRRIALPTYPFQRRRFWIEPRLPGVPGDSVREATPAAHAERLAPIDESDSARSDIGDWFALPSWKRSLPPGPNAAADLATAPACWLLFNDTYGLGQRLARRLGQLNQVVVGVVPGARFERIDDRIYSIDPAAPDDYKQLLGQLAAQDLAPSVIVYLWSVTAGPPPAATTPDFYRLLWLAQALGTQQSGSPLRLQIVSNNLQRVAGEGALQPEKAALLGPCRVIPLEYPSITCQSIDIVASEGDSDALEALSEQLLAEFAARSPEAILAYRGPDRWIQAIEDVRIERPAGAPARLREAGVYLITGGLGGVGLALAEYLARTVRARLVLVGRTCLPQRSEWAAWLEVHAEQDATSQKLRAVQALEALGAEVLVACADVADEQQMRAVIAEANGRFRAVHGVIHAAGVPGGGLIQRKTPEACASVFAPKIAGTQLLARLFQDQPLDFMVLCSAISPLRAEVGQVDYCAANAFMDAFAQQHARRGFPIISINWDRWEHVGMAVAVEQLHERLTNQAATGGMPRLEAVQAFERLLASAMPPQIIISPWGAQAQAKRGERVEPARFSHDLAPAQPTQAAHPRPELEAAYVAPRNEIEQQIGEIWQEFLGIDRLGIHDNFFDLGGDSLMGLNIIARLNQELDVEIPVVGLFEGPTIGALADLILRDRNRRPAYTKSQSRGQRRREKLMHYRDLKEREHG